MVQEDMKHWCVAPKPFFLSQLILLPCRLLKIVPKADGRPPVKVESSSKTYVRFALFYCSYPNALRLRSLLRRSFLDGSYQDTRARRVILERVGQVSSFHSSFRRAKILKSYCSHAVVTVPAYFSGSSPMTLPNTPPVPQ